MVWGGHRAFLLKIGIGIGFAAAPRAFARDSLPRHVALASEDEKGKRIGNGS